MKAIRTMKYWCSSDTVLQMLLFSGWRPQDRADCQTICSFSPSLLATFATSNPIGRKYAILTIFFKALIISRLNFIDTYFGPKTGLKKPKRDCKKAVVAMQLRPLRLSSVALLQSRLSFKGRLITMTSAYCSGPQFEHSTMHKIAH